MTNTEIEQLRTIAAELDRLRNMVSEMLNSDEPANDDNDKEPSSRNGKPQYASMRRSPRGLLRPGMSGKCKDIEFILDEDLRIRVTTGKLKGKVFYGPSPLAKYVYKGERNGFEYVTLEGRSLNDWRDKWMAIK